MTDNSSTSWRDERVVYIASGDRRVTASQIEEMLTERETRRQTARRPLLRRAVGRQAERDAVAARKAPEPPRGNLVPRASREPITKGLVAGRGQAPPNPPPPATTAAQLRELADLGDDLADAQREISDLRYLLRLRARVDKATVNYRPGSADRHCGNCAMYSDQTCDLVRGLIDPDAVCDRWIAR